MEAAISASVNQALARSADDRPADLVDFHRAHAPDGNLGIEAAVLAVRELAP
jgi:hypothetical protein